MKILISIIVCTYNRAEILQRCLRSLTEQIDPGCNYEVIIVNNKCTDSTNEIVDIFTLQYINYKQIMEPIQGLSCARNCGMNAAVGEYVAFIDDDAVAYPDWIHQIAFFIKRHPEISAFGGPYDAFTVVQPPNWFPPEYGSFSYGITERPLVHNKEWINGSNMIFTKQLLVRYGGFNERLGMRGHSVSYGEDTLLIQRLLDAGVIVFYVPTIKVMHLLSEYKMNLKWLLMASYRSGLNYGATFNKRLAVIDYVAIVIKSLIRFIRSLSPPYKEPFKRDIYYIFVNIFFGYGTLCEKIYGLKPQVMGKKNENTPSQ